MSSTYNNLPSKSTSDTAIVQAFDAYTKLPLEIDASTLDAMRGFFTSKGFDKTAAESVSVTIIKQAKKDKVRRIEWNVLDWNTPAIAFYEKSGARVLDDWRVAQMDEAAINYFVENKLN